MTQTLICSFLESITCKFEMLVVRLLFSLNRWSITFWKQLSVFFSYKRGDLVFQISPKTQNICKIDSLKGMQRNNSAKMLPYDRHVNYHTKLVYFHVLYSSEKRLQCRKLWSSQNFDNSNLPQNQLYLAQRRFLSTCLLISLNRNVLITFEALQLWSVNMVCLRVAVIQCFTIHFMGGIKFWEEVVRLGLKNG